MSGSETITEKLNKQEDKQEDEQEDEQTKAISAFQKVMPIMLIAYGQEGVLCRLSQVCFAERLIDQVTHETVQNSNYEGESIRAQIFVKKVYERIENAKGPIETATYIKRLAEVIEEADSIHEHISKEIASFKTASEFQTEMIRIGDSIQSDIMRIAVNAMSKHLISDAEYTLVAAPAGRHTDRCVQVLLNALKRHFQLCPGDLEGKFIPALSSSKMDDTTNIATRLREALTRKNDID